MDRTLNQYFTEPTWFAGKAVTVSNTIPSDNSFFFHYLISLYVSNDANVCIVGVKHTKEEYENTGRKLGTRLAQKERDGFVKYVSVPTGSVSPLSTEAIEAFFRDIITYTKTQTAATAILIDDLSTLLDLSANPTHTIRCIYQTISSIYDSPNALFCSLSSNLSDEASQLMYHCSHSCDIKPLDSGYSKDVNGQMIFTTLDSTLPQMHLRLHFVLHDHKIDVFVPGAE